MKILREENSARIALSQSYPRTRAEIQRVPEVKTRLALSADGSFPNTMYLPVNQNPVALAVRRRLFSEYLPAALAYASDTSEHTHGKLRQVR
jgi:hypothetical protein